MIILPSDLEIIYDRDVHTSDNLIIQKIADNSGDREFATYNILARYNWGTRTLVNGIENPYDAILFANAPKLLKRCRQMEKKLLAFERILGNNAPELTEDVGKGSE